MGRVEQVEVATHVARQFAFQKRERLRRRQLDGTQFALRGKQGNFDNLHHRVALHLLAPYLGPH